VFAATGSAAYDFYGADRAGDNLFANTILALDASTGQRRWHYQVVRHDLWDRDLPAPPNLVQVTVGDKAVDAVAQVTKSGHVFVLDRDTGKPLFPMTEAPVTGRALPGEAPALSQPLPTHPAPFTRQVIEQGDLATRASADPAKLRRWFDNLQHSGPFTLPSVQGTLLMPGFDGGAEWGGAAWDPQSGLLYVNANEVASVLQMYPANGTGQGEFINPRGAYLMTCALCHGVDRKGYGPAGPNLRNISDRLSFMELYETIYHGRGRMPGFGELMGRAGTLLVMYYLYTAGDEPVASFTQAEINEAEAFFHLGWQSFTGADGLPGITPPWGTLNAIDLQTGAIRWRIPLGNYPLANALGITGAGAENYGG
ncbi:MAG: c-type cytochrome, partial [Halioglobus sp.]